MGKSEIYSWRLSRETKAILEEEARRQHTSLAGLLDRIVQEWRHRRLLTDDDDSTEQARLHAAAARSFGRIAGTHPYGAARTRAVIRQRLRRTRDG